MARQSQRSQRSAVTKMSKDESLAYTVKTIREWINEVRNAGIQNITGVEVPDTWLEDLLDEYERLKKRVKK
jgi:hypothetical protein